MDLKDETGNAIVPILACVLNQLCMRNDKLPQSSRMMTKFHALRPPAISIKDYLYRIAKYAACSGECFVLALVYIDRIIQSNPHFIVNSLNIHRLLITSIMLAAKFFDDQYFNNAYYAKVGGVPCAEINVLEVEFLFMTNFTLFVTTETFKQYYQELCNHAYSTSCSCGAQRGKLPRLYIPPDKYGEITYRYDDEDDEEEEEEPYEETDPGSQATGAASPADSPSEATEPIAMSDSPAPPPRRLQGPGAAPQAAAAAAAPARQSVPAHMAAAAGAAQGGQLAVAYPGGHMVAVPVPVHGGVERKAPAPYSQHVAGWATAPAAQFYPASAVGYAAPYVYPAAQVPSAAAPASASRAPSSAPVPMQTGSPPISSRAS